MSSYKISNDQLDRILDPMTDCLQLSPIGRIFDKNFLQYRLDMFDISQEHYKEIFEMDILTQRKELKDKIYQLLSYIGTKILDANDYALYCRYNDEMKGNEYTFKEAQYKAVKNTPDVKISNLLQSLEDISCLQYQLAEGDTEKRFSDVLEFLNYLKLEYMGHIVARTTFKYMADITD